MLGSVAIYEYSATVIDMILAEIKQIPRTLLRDVS